MNELFSCLFVLLLNPNPLVKLDKIVNALRLKYRTYIMEFEEDCVSFYPSHYFMEFEEDCVSLKRIVILFFVCNYIIEVVCLEI